MGKTRSGSCGLKSWQQLDEDASSHATLGQDSTSMVDHLETPGAAGIGLNIDAAIEVNGPGQIWASLLVQLLSVPCRSSISH